MKKLFFLQPLVFSILPIIVLYANNSTQSWPSLMLRPLVYSIVFASISWLFFYAFYRKKSTTNIMTSFWLILFFSYEHIYLFLANTGLFELLPFGPHLFLLSLYLVLIVSILFLLFKYKQLTQPLTHFLNVTAVVLLIFNTVPLLFFELSRVQALYKLRNFMASQYQTTEYTNNNVEQYPDIYYFVFDRYAEKSITQDYFNYDNSGFFDELRNEKFFVATQSAANYPATFLSLSSSLNMTHLTFMDELVGSEYSDQSIAYAELIQKNQVTKFLKERGYNYYHFGSSWEPTKSSPLAEESYNLFENFNEFEAFLYENTLLNALLGKISESKQLFTGKKLLEIHSKNLDYKTKKILATTQENGPKFIFAHYLLPHPPYLFDENCNSLDLEVVRHREEKTAYVAQLKCANKIMDQLSETIIANTDRPAVIIFQSDEGPFAPSEYFDDYKYKETSNNDAYKIHGRILNAIYATTEQDGVLAPIDPATIGFTQSTTPVNTFRLIFNKYFGTNYEQLENRTYIYSDNKKPYDMDEITHKIWD